MGQAFSQKSRMDTSLSRSGMMHCLMKRYQTNHDEEPMAEHLKDELRKNTQENMWNTKFAKPSILGKPVGQPLKNQSVVRQPTAFKSERPRISKPRFASQVDVNNDLSKPVTTHHLPKGRESAPAKPHHMIAPSSSRWQPTGRILKTVCLRWVPTGKTFASSTTKVHQVQSYKGRLRVWLRKRKDISENRASRNFDLMITQMTFEHNIQASVVNVRWRLLKITLQAPFLNVQMTFEHNSSSLGLHGNDVCSHQLGGLFFHQMTSDHNRSELGIQDHSNEQSSLKLVPKVVP
ncbi:hypothetical protein Tco_0632764 [Tanacetum coccineum]